MDNNYVGHQNNYRHRDEYKHSNHQHHDERWKLFATITSISVIGLQNIYCDGVKGPFTNNVI